MEPYGWNQSFEGLVAGVIAKFQRDLQPDWETDRKFNRMRPSMARVWGFETRQTQADPGRPRQFEGSQPLNGEILGLPIWIWVCRARSCSQQL